MHHPKDPSQLFSKFCRVTKVMGDPAVKKYGGDPVAYTIPTASLKTAFMQVRTRHSWWSGLGHLVDMVRVASQLGCVCSWVTMHSLAVSLSMVLPRCTGLVAVFLPCSHPCIMSCSILMCYSMQ